MIRALSRTNSPSRVRLAKMNLWTFFKNTLDGEYGIFAEIILVLNIAFIAAIAILIVVTILFYLGLSFLLATPFIACFCYPIYLYFKVRKNV